ncbi:MAG TPA: DotH/IcmK family type IV secretion protein, partial [Alphaproteobacteria bacterium]|nr:DotH/IcmK family type IV secretion protein [Alphaproteobacteria bacterium]
MKHLLLCMASVLVLTASAGLAQAQPAEDDPLAAFEKNLPRNDSLGGGNQLLPGASGANPLGVGGALPVGIPGVPGGMPATAEEMQALMEEEAAEQRRKLEEQTFEAALKQLLPLKPDQIRRTLQEFQISREAAETPITVPEPRQVVQTVSLDTADAPVVVKMAVGYITTITILDSSGA